MGIIRDLEKKLFEEWAEKRPGLVTDGVIDEEGYLNSEVKVLYILKEVHGGKNWDLRSFVRKAEKGKTWNNVARWQYGIEHLNKDISWSSMPSINQVFRQKYLKNIAALNLKKASGGSRTASKELSLYSWSDRELLKRQISIYNSDIVVCCGTGELVRDIGLFGSFYSWKTSSEGIRYAIIDDKVIVSFTHPQASISAQSRFFDLRKTLREARNI